MKKMVLIGLMLIAGTSFAAPSQTANLVISGVVTAVNEIEITPNANATTLNIIGGEISKSVASISETSNNLTGYQIYMRSASGSKLVHGVDPSKTTAYKISYDGAAEISLPTTDVSMKNVTSLAGLTTVASDVKVSVTPYATAPAGTYSDTITVSIVANN